MEIPHISSAQMAILMRVKAQADQAAALVTPDIHRLLEMSVKLKRELYIPGHIARALRESEAALAQIRATLDTASAANAVAEVSEVVRQMDVALRPQPLYLRPVMGYDPSPALPVISPPDNADGEDESPEELAALRERVAELEAGIREMRLTEALGGEPYPDLDAGDFWELRN